VAGVWEGQEPSRGVSTSPRVAQPAQPGSRQPLVAGEGKQLGHDPHDVVLAP
jgi:hypothetical protein